MSPLDSISLQRDREGAAPPQPETAPPNVPEKKKSPVISISLQRESERPKPERKEAPVPPKVPAKKKSPALSISLQRSKKPAPEAASDDPPPKSKPAKKSPVISISLDRMERVPPAEEAEPKKPRRKPRKKPEPKKLTDSERNQLLKKIKLFNQEHRGFCSPQPEVLSVDTWPRKAELLATPIQLNMSQVPLPRRAEIIGKPKNLAELDNQVTAAECRLLMRPLAFSTQPVPVELTNLYQLGFWAVIMQKETPQGRVFRLVGLGPDSILKFDELWQYFEGGKELTYKAAGTICLVTIQTRHSSHPHSARVVRMAEKLGIRDSSEDQDDLGPVVSAVPYGEATEEGENPGLLSISVLADALAHSQACQIAGFADIARDAHLTIVEEVAQSTANKSDWVIVFCRDGALFQRFCSPEGHVSVNFVSADGADHKDFANAHFVQGLSIGGKATVQGEDGERFQTDLVVAIAYRPLADEEN